MLATNVHGREIAGTLEKTRFAVIPLGSVEYHGPHSPLGTDIVLSEGFAERIDPELGPLIYPVVPYTACPGKTEHYPGTISIRPSVFIDYLSDIAEDICRFGIRNIILLNAHDANMGPSRTVAEYVTGKYPDASFLLINWWQMAAISFTQEKGYFGGAPGRGHGGPYEMSAVKAFRPDLVSVEDGDEDLDSPAALSPLPYVLVEGTPQGWDGYTGQIRHTSLEAGQSIVEEAAKNMNVLIRNWLTTRSGI
ncbi:creatininase family protein [Paenibacillus hodogayensis]|uniref:Creatininase family protein n=1 Tax=Paenibacillus hodogayensis TaxID=279208 RepID=A0ABV5VVZ5_9BACL